MGKRVAEAAHVLQRTDRHAAGGMAVRTLAAAAAGAAGAGRRTPHHRACVPSRQAHERRGLLHRQRAGPVRAPVSRSP